MKQATALAIAPRNFKVFATILIFKGQKRRAGPVEGRLD
jgi:hypothetical protein